MIVEVPVIGALALHVLFYVKEGSFSLFELPVKQLQFSPCPFHSIPASIHLDLAGFGKCEPGLAEPEWLCKRDHLTLSLVHSDSSGFKTPYNFMAHQFCFIHRGEKSIVIIHVMTGAMNMGLTLIHWSILLGKATISCWEGSTPKGKPRPGVGHGEY